MGRGQKRKRGAVPRAVPRVVPRETWNTKCSVSSICHSDNDEVRPFLSEVIEYCNKLRVLVSIVAKHHIFVTLKEQAEKAALRGDGTNFCPTYIEIPSLS
jgi:hypothetical protein